MALPLWSWFPFSVERENNFGFCEVRQVRGCEGPWDPEVWGAEACWGGQLVGGHAAHPLQLGWSLHCGAGERVVTVCVAVPGIFQEVGGVLGEHGRLRALT